jgi:hypothetical protein
MISVSNAHEVPTLAAVAKHVKEEGHYCNARGTLGYWATIRSGDHWYMVSVSDGRITQINYLDRCCLPRLYQAGRKKS